jgi:hypothetical protein
MACASASGITENDRMTKIEQAKARIERQPFSSGRRERSVCKPPWSAANQSSIGKAKMPR